MAARTTMAALIALVRGLINDPTGASQAFTDDQIQEHLDYFRLYTNDTLTSLSNQAGTVIGWKSASRNWEDGAVLVDESLTILSALSSNFLSGYWTFTINPSSVYVSGWTYDVYASASELLTLWAGKLGSDITKFSADGSSYEFGSVKNQKLALAAQYMAKSSTMGGPRTAEMVRNDLNVSYRTTGSNGETWPQY